MSLKEFLRLSALLLQEAESAERLRTELGNAIIERDKWKKMATDLAIYDDVQRIQMRSTIALHFEIDEEFIRQASDPREVFEYAYKKMLQKLHEQIGKI